MTTIPVELLQSQRAFIESTAPEVMYSGAFGAGKSRAGCEKGYFLNVKYPGNFGAIVRKNFTDLRHSTMETWFKQVMPEDGGRLNKVTNLLTQVNGSRVLFTGIDEASSIGSMEFGWVFVDESIELKEDDWMMLLGRLRLANVPFHQIFTATNPGSPSHWLYRRFFQEQVGDVFHGNALENRFTPQHYRDRLNSFKGIYYDRYVLGKWVGMEGVVYPGFDPGVHVLNRNEWPFDPNNPPRDWTYYRAIDFGYTNPFVCQWWACPPRESYQDKPLPWYMWKEVYMSQRTMEDHAKVINQESDGIRIQSTITDWDSGDRAILESHNIPTRQASKAIQPGIQHIQDMIGHNQIFFLEDSVVETDYRLKESGLPTSTTEEFPGYVWPPSKDNRSEKEVPLDKDNHGMDALRYLMFTMGFQSGWAETRFGGRSTMAEARESVEPPSRASRAGRWAKDRGVFGGFRRFERGI